MVHTRPALPSGHGEVIERPEFAEWGDLLARNRSEADRWDFTVADRPVREVRELARRELLGIATVFSARLGVDVMEAREPDAPLVATGHQPELYHPGVWVKDFLLERLARQLGANAVDVVVDSDGFDSVSVTSPCMTPGIARCKQYLALGATDGCFACTPVPSQQAIADFCQSADAVLSSLPAPAVRRHFAGFCEKLTSAAADAANLAELVTFARRRYEASAGTSYLEAPATAISRSRAFAHFVVDLAANAPRFSSAYNAELAAYRTQTKTRSAAQPFPDLRVEGQRFELPLWSIAGGRRTTVWADLAAETVTLSADGVALVVLPRSQRAAVDALAASDALIAPKALALTLFVRVYACDLFIHGVGGGRYDRVTDGVIRAYYGVTPPAFVVASMTMFLPLGAKVVGEAEIAAAKDRLNRLEHNPDALLAEVDFDDSDEREHALSLAEEKALLVRAIAAADADKKSLGARIRQVNADLSKVLAPLRSAYQHELDSLESQREASEILTDRTYPFCFWDPAEVADKVW